MYRKLERAWGAQHWWPAESVFEVIVGAILTQNTSWTNVERALVSLRAAGALSPGAVRSLPVAQLETFVRSSGYYRQKAERLKRFVKFLDDCYQGSLELMFATPTSRLRTELLSLKGIGPETADAILLYAGNHEIFVVDTYARRILARHGVVEPVAKYDDIRTLIERALRKVTPRALVQHKPRNKPEVHSPSAVSTAKRSSLAQVYNEMHGLMVQAGKHYCHKQEALCDQCPLRSLLPNPPLHSSL